MGDRLVLIGGGGHCKSVLDAAECMHRFEEIVITDPGTEPGTLILGHEVVGSDELLVDLLRQGFSFAFVTVGSIKSTRLRKKLASRIERLGFTVPDVVDPSAAVSRHARIGKGVFIGKNAVVNADAQIDDYVIVNSASVIEHECHVGEFTHVAVGARLCGNVDVGSDSLIGAGSIVIQGVQLGRKVIIGAGSLILRDVPDGSKVYDARRRITQKLDKE